LAKLWDFVPEYSGGVEQTLPLDISTFGFHHIIICGYELETGIE